MAVTIENDIAGVGGSGGGSWGEIEGTLSDQTDLQDALDDKADSSDLTAKANLASPTFTGAVTVPGGTVSAPGINFTHASNTGLFGSGSGNVQVAINGENTAAFIDGGSYKYMRLHAETTPNSNYIDWYYWNSQDAMYFDIHSVGGTASNFFKVTSSATTNFGYQMVVGSEVWELKMYNATAVDELKGCWGVVHDSSTYGNRTYVTWDSVGSMSVGPDRVGIPQFQVKAHPDYTMTGTTTVNASTTVTGSSTRFTEELAIGDHIAVSSAATTFARVTAIASNTSCTVSTALGNGTSQTIVRRRGLTTWKDRSDNITVQIDPNGCLVPLHVADDTARDALPLVRAGSIVWNVADAKLNVYNGSAWEEITSS